MAQVPSPSGSGLSELSDPGEILSPLPGTTVS